MALVVNTNVTSLIAQRRLDVASKALNVSLERLSSGFRINRTGDDAAGLTISQNLTSQIRRMKQNVRNTVDGISLLQITEGALTTINDNLQRIRELTVQAMNDTYDTAARAAATQEVRELVNDIDRIAKSVQFNGTPILTNQYSAQLTAPIHVGPNADTSTNVVDLSPAFLDTRVTGTLTGLPLIGPGSTTGFNVLSPSDPPLAGEIPIDLTDRETSRLFLNDVDATINRIVNQRATIGALQNKLESSLTNLDSSIENFSTANSRIRDVDIAAETAVMVQNQILTQAATTVLAQTNQLPQLLLSLLKQS